MNKQKLLKIFLVFIGVVMISATCYTAWKVNKEIDKTISELNHPIIVEHKVPEGMIPSVTEEQKEAKPTKTEIDIKKWEIYRNEKRRFEIKYPKDWEIHVGDPERSINFTRKTTLGKVDFGIGINLYGDVGFWEGCRFIGNKITIEGITIYPTIYTALKKGVQYTEEECHQLSLGDYHLIEASMCLENNSKYLGPDCPFCPDSHFCPEWKKSGYWGRYYQFFISCIGKEWQGREGLNKCIQLFNQITSSFRFIKM